MRRAFLAIAILAALGSCSPQREYVKADAATYTVLSPYTLAGIDASDQSEEQKADLRDLVKTWEFRIRQNGGFAEGAR